MRQSMWTASGERAEASCKRATICPPESTRIRTTAASSMTNGLPSRRTLRWCYKCQGLHLARWSHEQRVPCGRDPLADGKLPTEFNTTSSADSGGRGLTGPVAMGEFGRHSNF